ncbi:MAG: MOSC domain-containing protein [Anaerolineae bacterium]|nr:MOSC domain-containing protein [Anaerolineae bacterium]
MQKVTAQVRGLMVMHPGNSPVSTPQPALEIVAEGVHGDSHAGLTRIKNGEEIGNTRQVTVVSVEELDLVAGELEIPEIKAEWIGANILVEGVENLSSLPHGTRLHFPSGAVLFVEEANTPCSSAGRSIQARFTDRTDLPAQFPKAAVGKRGLLAWVKQPGSVQLGDAVRIELPA